MIVDVSVKYKCERSHEKSHKYSREKFFMKDLYRHESIDSFVFHFSINRDIFQIFFESHSFLSWKSYVNLNSKSSVRSLLKQINNRFEIKFHNFRHSRLFRSFKRSAISNIIVFNDVVDKQLIFATMFSNEIHDDDASFDQINQDAAANIIYSIFSDINFKSYLEQQNQSRRNIRKKSELNNVVTITSDEKINDSKIQTANDDIVNLFLKMRMKKEIMR